MKTLLKRIIVGMAIALSAFATNATVIATVTVGGGNAYPDDYDIVIGLGSTATPVWSQQVAWSHNSSDGFWGSVSLDISARYDAAENQTWWVLVDDNWSINASYLTGFIIDTGLATLISPDTPIYIEDNGQAYAFIRPPTSSTVPEPGTLALGAAALLGILLLRLGVKNKRLSPRNLYLRLCSSDALNRRARRPGGRR